MSRTINSGTRATIVDDDRRRGRLLAKAFQDDSRFAEISVHTSLNEAFSGLECDPPEIVLIAGTFETRDDFPMLEAMLAMLNVPIRFLDGAAADSRDSVRDQTSATAYVDGVAKSLGLVKKSRQVDVPQKLLDMSSKMILVGSSTGGIEALISLLARFPKDCPPTLIVQHIKPNFVDGMIARLNGACAPTVNAAAEGVVPSPGRVLVAPGVAAHLTLHPRTRRCVLVDEDPVSGHRPSVDRMFQSALPYAKETVAVMLTGMGRDGAQSMLALRRAGARTFGQDEASCVVYGMPRAAMSLGAVERELPIGRLGDAVLEAACGAEARL